MHCRSTTPQRSSGRSASRRRRTRVGLLGDVVVLRAAIARGAREYAGDRAERAAAAGACSSKVAARARGEARAWDLPERGSHQQDGQLVHAARPAAARRSAAGLSPPRRSIWNSPAARAARSSSRRTSVTSLPSSRSGARSGASPCSSTRCARENNWGIGDFTDLAELLRLAAGGRRGFRRHQPRACVVSVGPDAVFAVFRVEPPRAERDVHRRRERCSKCRARGARRRSWRDSGFRARLAKARAATHVDYPAVASLKMPVLQAAFERFRTEHLARHTARAAACREFLRERGEAMRLHTLFDAIDRHLRRHQGTGAGLAQLAARNIASPDGEAVRRFAQRTCRRGGFPWLPAVARRRAVRRGAQARARARV